MKTTMLFLLNNGKNVDEYYDLSELGNRNVYLQVVNTYVSIDKALKLIKRLKPYGSNS
jgi:hypothetical protein